MVTAYRKAKQRKKEWQQQSLLEYQKSKGFVK